MKQISKSNFVAYKNCPKSLWLLLHKEEEYVSNPSQLKHIEDGKMVGALARQYFEQTVDVTSFKDDGSLDIKKMVELTQHYLSQNKETIAEASFSQDNLFCSTDLLKRVENGYEIYEVKATTRVDNEHIIDAAFQKYVLQKRGLNIVKTYILYLNKDYRRKGELDLNKLFSKEEIDLNPLFVETLSNLKSDIENINQMLETKEEPSSPLLTRCKQCPFKAYCHRHIPSPSVLDVNGLHGYDYLNKGIVTYQDLLFSNVKLKKRQIVQIQTHLQHETLSIDQKGLKTFLKTIKYPVYHLDFESYQTPIPPANNTWPNEQIPTQYSLHIEYEDGKLEHKEFLGNSFDPRREIAESLCQNIPDDACVTAYNKTFECGRLKELAELYPDLKNHLLKISDNVIDLIVPFKNGSLYHEQMGKSNSIKAVLPAFYPNDSQLDYHALPIVHNGGEAMDIYPKMLTATIEEKERIRNGLLQYCCLDTLAMVKVLRKIKEFS